jgi:23S rRNA (adenine2503-C2)-methyltransferase
MATETALPIELTPAPIDAPPRPAARPGLRRATRPVSVFDFTLPELEAKAVELGQPAFRGRQIASWLYDSERLANTYEQMTDLPAGLRARLAEELPISTLTPVRELQTDNGDTVKTLYRSQDGQFIETVLMLYRDRATVCVSCQVGCAVGCGFCATGLNGLTRNLTAGEMVEQTVNAARRAKELGRPLTNLVMMGMGEPFQNYAETMKFVGILNDPKGFNFGARRITISTSGIVPKIDSLAEEPYQVNLAVSIHAPNDELRDTLVPINKRWPVEQLLAAIERYVEKTGRRVSFEYALMGGINDSDETANELAKLLKGRLCHVNLIPYNPVDVLSFTRPSPERIDNFAAMLQAAGVPTTVRYSRGVEIAAACGQLRGAAISSQLSAVSNP